MLTNATSLPLLGWLMLARVMARKPLVSFRLYSLVQLQVPAGQVTIYHMQVCMCCQDG
jgi:hypothetical protein